MSEEGTSFRTKHRRALREAIKKSKAHKSNRRELFDKIGSRVSAFRALGVDLASSAVMDLDLQFQLAQWSANIRLALEKVDGSHRKRLATAVGRQLDERGSLRNQRRAGEAELDDAYAQNDSLAGVLLYACDWTVERLWEGDASVDEAIRDLARKIAMDWKWVTGADLPKVPAKASLWGPREKDSAAHPLWVALDAAGIRVGWGPVRVLTNYACGRYPSAGGGVGRWAMDSVVLIEGPE